MSCDNSKFRVNYVHLPLFHRLFQVIVRIDDCLALLNLVSKGVGDVSVTLTVIPGKGGYDVAKGLYWLHFEGPTHAREL